MASSVFTFTNHHLFDDMSFTRSTDPVYGINLFVTSPRLNDRFSLMLRTSFTSNDFYQYKQTVASTGVIYHEDIYFSYSTTRFLAGIQYTYPAGRIRPFVGGGLVYNIIGDHDFRQVVTVEVQDLMEYVDVVRELVPNNTPGVYAQLGMDLKVFGRHHLSFLVRYQAVPSMVDQENQYNSLSAAVGYRF